MPSFTPVSGWTACSTVVVLLGTTRLYTMRITKITAISSCVVASQFCAEHSHFRAYSPHEGNSVTQFAASCRKQ